MEARVSVYHHYHHPSLHSHKGGAVAQLVERWTLDPDDMGLVPVNALFLQKATRLPPIHGHTGISKACSSHTMSMW